MRLLLLTTTGARTGQRRAVPLTYLPDDGRYVVTAGNAGSDSHPAWYYNLAADPGVTVEAGNEAFEAVAVIAGEAERAALFERFAVAYPQLDGYQELTARQIPLVILTRRQRSRRPPARPRTFGPAGGPELYAAPVQANHWLVPGLLLSRRSARSPRRPAPPSARGRV
jgi:deazaflavin-dependent oxidoreductase (nitroreductase family)